MFEVLVYVYENYWQGDACPAPPQLGRKLTAAGFDADEIEAALIWLDGLNTAAQSTQIYLPRLDATPPIAVSTPLTLSSSSLRIYSTAEQDHLGASALGFVSFLETSGVLAPQMREIVIDRAMASPGSPLELDDLKIIVLMVYWSFGQEPDALILDELCDDPNRVGH
jgi:Smg protein